MEQRFKKRNRWRWVPKAAKIAAMTSAGILAVAATVIVGGIIFFLWLMDSMPF